MTEKAKPAKPVEKLEYAGFFIRLLAIIIDFFILTVPNMAVAFFLGGFSTMATYSLSKDIGMLTSMMTQMTTFTITLAVGFLYFSLMESSRYQGTIGKMILGLKVVDLDGRRISFGKAALRYFGRIVVRFTLYIGYVMIGFSQKKQGLHDLIAQTYVVRKA